MTKKLLHVGPGNSYKDNTTPFFNSDNWIETRLDINPDVNPDIIGSMLDMSSINDCEFDAVYTSHNIEHVYAHEIGKALAEMYRVLKDDGFLFITCPDLQEICKVVAEGNLLNPLYEAPNGDSIAAIDMLYGHRPSLAAGNHYMAHKSGLTIKALSSELRLAGFLSISAVKSKEAYQLWCLAYKNITKTQEEIDNEILLHFANDVNVNN